MLFSKSGIISIFWWGHLGSPVNGLDCHCVVNRKQVIHETHFLTKWVSVSDKITGLKVYILLLLMTWKTHVFQFTTVQSKIQSGPIISLYGRSLKNGKDVLSRAGWIDNQAEWTFTKTCFVIFWVVISSLDNAGYSFENRGHFWVRLLTLFTCNAGLTENCESHEL